MNKEMRDKIIKDLKIPEKYQELSDIWQEFEEKLVEFQAKMQEKDIYNEKYQALFQTEVVAFLINVVGEEQLPFFLQDILQMFALYQEDKDFEKISKSINKKNKEYRNYLG